MERKEGKTEIKREGMQYRHGMKRRMERKEKRSDTIGSKKEFPEIICSTECGYRDRKKNLPKWSNYLVHCPQSVHGAFREFLLNHCTFYRLLLHGAQFNLT
jgi:hypothetical protein